MPAICDIVVENDADFYYSFAYQTLAGAPIDLTYASFLMKIRRTAQDAVAVLELSTETGEISIVDAINGIFTIMIKQPVLVGMELGSYEHSLVITLNTIKDAVWSGSFTINAGASR